MWLGGYSRILLNNKWERGTQLCSIKSHTACYPLVIHYPADRQPQQRGRVRRGRGRARGQAEAERRGRQVRHRLLRAGSLSTCSWRTESQRADSLPPPSPTTCAGMDAARSCKSLPVANQRDVAPSPYELDNLVTKFIITVSNILQIAMKLRQSGIHLRFPDESSWGLAPWELAWQRHDFRRTWRSDRYACCEQLQDEKQREWLI